MLGHKLSITQKHALTHQQYVSLKILSMSNHELNDYMSDLMLSNPAVDIDESGTSEKSILVSYDDARTEFVRRRNSTNPAADSADILKTVGRTDVDLQSYLRMQVRDSSFPPEDVRRLNKIIDRVDKRGYIDESSEDMCRLLRTSEEDYLRLLSVVQGFEPAGVAARSLKECLTLQLRRLDEPNPLAETIVRDYLPELGANKLPKIARLCRVSLEEVTAAKELIRSLRPVPVTDLVNDDTGFVIPDLVVAETPGGFDLRIIGPTCVANTYYRELMRGQQDPETRAYIGNCYKEIRAVQYGIEQRNHTLLGIARLILEKQRDFFIYGKPSLHTLRQSDISAELGIHESTVSRAIRDKCLQCRWGTFPLKYFFSVNLEAGGPVQNANPSELIRELIEGEPPSAPLSDQRLAEELSRRGIAISRRTVTKYRLALGIGTAAQRKKY